MTGQCRERWTQNYYTMRDHVLSSIPYPLRVVVGHLVYRNMTHTLHGQGTGQYTDDEIGSFQREIWDCISGVLSEAKENNITGDDESDDGPFWLLAGTEPTEADAALFGFIISTLVCTAYVGCPNNQLARFLCDDGVLTMLLRYFCWRMQMPPIPTPCERMPRHCRVCVEDSGAVFSRLCEVGVNIDQ